MSQVAFRRDFDDPHVVAVRRPRRHRRAAQDAVPDDARRHRRRRPDTLTPWKEDLLWRLYVDAYNHLTLGYADELIQKDPAGLSVVVADRPDDITEAELSTLPRGPAAPLPDALRPGVDLPPRAAGARHSARTRSTRCSSSTTTSGS